MVSATVLEPETPPTLSSNQAVIIGNVGVLISSLVLLVSAIVTLLGTEHNPRVPKKAMLAVSFLISIAAVIVVSVFSALNLFPEFLISGSPTLLRLIVLALTTIFYFASSVLFGWQYVRAKSRVVYWFSLALALFGTAYLSGVLTIHLGSAMTWFSRLGLYLSGVFLLFALLGPEGKTEKQPYSAKWSEGFRSDQKQMETFISKIAEGFAYCKIILDREGKPVDWLYLDVNDSYERINNSNRKEIVGRKATEVLPGIREDPADWINLYGHVALIGEPIVLERFSKNRNKWYRVSAYSPQKGYFVALLEDITQRKKAEEDLTKAKSQYELLFNSVTEGFANYKIVFDKTGNLDLLVLDINPAGAAQSGVKSEEQIGKTWRQVWQGIPEEVFDIYLRVYETGKSGTFEHFSPVTQAWYIITVSKSAEDQFAVTFFDITERKKAEDALKQRTETLEQTQKKLEENACLLEECSSQMEELAKQRLEKLKDAERLAAIGATAGMVGHDIRNPLQAITGDLFLAKSEVSVLPESEQKKAILESLEESEQNIDYINKIVQDLQDYARPLNPKTEESDLKQIIEKLLAKNGLPKNIKVKVEVSEQASKIRADSYYINRIMYNLVTNSVQAMPNGGNLTIQAYKEANNIVIAVKDTGVGIPKVIQGKLFTPMFTTKSKGHGFGLPVVKRMAESLGGTVIFESQEGKGTTFTVRLPPPQGTKR